MRPLLVLFMFSHLFLVAQVLPDSAALEAVRQPFEPDTTSISDRPVLRNNLTLPEQLLNEGLDSQYLLVPVTWKPKYKRYIAPGVAALLSGVADGLNQVVRHDYAAFKRAFPGANDQWFDPSVSWMNKYKDRNPDNGPAYWLSTSLLVAPTDFDHTTQTIERFSYSLVIALHPYDRNKPFWVKYIVEPLTYYAIRQIAFSITYNAIRNG